MQDLKAKWAIDLGLGKNPTARLGAPVSFTSHLASILPGQTQVLGTSGLSNGYRTPYVIDEIRMQAYMTTPATTYLQPSYAMAFQFRTGAYAFSLKPVPMVLYSPRYGMSPARPGLYLQAPGVPPRGPLLASEFTPTGDTTYVYGDSARWVLAKPLWMAPGDQIQCLAERHVTAASSGNGAFAADITYVGRSLPPGTKGPATRFVPWASHFIFDFTSDTYAQTTTEFRNQFTFPMTIQKFVGRPLSKATNGLFDTSGPEGTLPRNTLTNTYYYAQVNIQDSLGYKITNQFSPVGNVFDAERGVWTFARPLGAREQIDMQFKRAGVLTSPNNASPIYGVGMLGYREERG